MSSYQFSNELSHPTKLKLTNSNQFKKAFGLSVTNFYLAKHHIQIVNLLVEISGRLVALLADDGTTLVRFHMLNTLAVVMLSCFVACFLYGPTNTKVHRLFTKPYRVKMRKLAATFDWLSVSNVSR